MSLGELVRRPRYLLYTFLALSLLPAAALIWAGRMLLNQDRILEESHVQERRGALAELVEVALRQAIATSEERLADPKSWQQLASDDAFAVYYPISPPLREAPREQFAAGDTDELAGDADFA